MVGPDKEKGEDWHESAPQSSAGRRNSAPAPQARSPKQPACEEKYNPNVHGSLLVQTCVRRNTEPQSLGTIKLTGGVSKYANKEMWD